MSASSLLAGRSGSSWAVRGVTFLVWLALAFSTTYWGLQWQESGASRPTSASGVAASAGDTAAGFQPAALGRALGAVGPAIERVAAPALASRLVLVRVVRAGARDGAALIAIDGKPARSVRLHAEVEPGLYLVGLEPRRASLGPEPRGPESLVLELPKPKEP